jgi:LETM1 and EF-hand domain-containing protein 1
MVGHRSFSNEAPQGKPSILVRVKEGALHYWHGTKLLVYETKISYKLLMKLLRGEKLIRREYRQLLRTTGDMVRLVPFIIIMVVPFLEFALPVILKLFPNMLPSSFEDRLQAEEKVKKQLKVKLETAKFLQDMAENMTGKAGTNVKDLKQLFEKTRTSGANLTAEEVVEISQKLGEEITLENLGRPELLSLCKYMSLNAFGTDNFLRYQIRKVVEKLKQDDLMIYNEGIDSMTTGELKAACHARGIRTIDVPEYYMRRELQQWVEMQVKHSVPAPLLILSRAFALSEDVKMEDALRAAVTSLPENVLSEAHVQAEDATHSSSATEKIRVIEQQERIISEELEQERAAKDTSRENLSDEQLDSISDAVVTLATKNPTVQEKEDLAELIEEQAQLQSAATISSNNTVKAVGEQVAKLIKDIDQQIGQFDSELGKRLQIISSGSDGTISTGQLKAIMKMVKNSPKDAEKVAQAVKAFDSDGDGKIFIEDIIRIAEDSEHREGRGYIEGDCPDAK